MIHIELVSIAKLDLYRGTRLAALQDTPMAFGSTYARESAFEESVWRDRVVRNQSDQSCCFLAIDDENESDIACGIAGAMIETESAHASLFSMWVAPSHRRSGIGQRLVETCIEWCRARNIKTIHLLVTDWNAGAIRFYERLGFAMTGKSEPYPNAPDMVEFEMAMTL